MKSDRWTQRAVLMLAALTALLSGCTSYVTTQVTAFSDWRGNDASRTYAFTRSPAQQNSIEQSTYELLVANQLAVQSFRQVDEQQAHYLVGLSYGTHAETVNVAEPVFYSSPWPGPFWGRPYDPWGAYGPFPPAYVNQSYPVFTHSLGIRITDRATGKEVYNVMARNAGEEPSLVRAMPYLVSSALADFPLGNGAVRTIKMPVVKNAGMSNQAAGSAAPAAPASTPSVVQ
ncbi:DUF4136 domain-containing protein [Paraburkholderia sp. DHOC27]|uniref:DUF4136 domain-containing protein n=1 Tax=Paraburkholderia sp. DHOC27 TaxID=2303330 RepID=UPI000E3DD985|nr:DUF4136 domain-containing protein [Paraburkholderia sp. DHOC27]RFU46807.1 DUF4136 domain-containing protein [Paraburkholderia sp. DHOC27]